MERRPIFRSFAVGVTCGLRSMSGPAIVRWRAGDPARLALAALAAGELIADKLPATPARTIPPALAFRAVSGGFSGRGVAAAFAGDLTAGMVAGAAGAVIAAYAGQRLRARIVAATGLPDWLVAAAEDALAIGCALAATRPPTSPGRLPPPEKPF